MKKLTLVTVERSSIQATAKSGAGLDDILAEAVQSTSTTDTSTASSSSTDTSTTTTEATGIQLNTVERSSIQATAKSGVFA